MRKARGRSRGPLRRIVGVETLWLVSDRLGVIGCQVYEVLECGHRLHPAQDAIGRVYPTRRRCWKCQKGIPPWPVKLTPLTEIRPYREEDR